ncbi:acetyltransferase [Prolixibacter bellariivorans]|uniref:Acetyltransferase n=1 Tax=Prolixibacter bellariivorans TaxID=314319 RepID=A0A5M4B5B1_9BACT|nr:GNAT family N-acetyltransferase [Prolixibacter bellariivorans]GET35053.1 acetyltransferase [Prolixibacter bellariivorans]
MEITFRSLEQVAFDELFNAFHSAFADYEISISKEELRLMLVRRGFDASLSVGAFDGDRLVSFILNGTGTFQGLPTAYDTGTGTAKSYRGQGLVTRLFNESLPALREAGIKQYLLEVLQNNDKAISLYKRLGFEVTRSFHYYRQSQSQLTLPPKALLEGFSLQETSLPADDIAESFADFHPSWQNTIEAFHRNPETFYCVTCCHEGIPVGYGISEFETGDISWLSVDKRHRRIGIGTALLKSLLEKITTEQAKVVNTASDAESLNAFLEVCGFPLGGKQYEMIQNFK